MAEPSFVASGTYFDGSSAAPAFAVPSGTAAGRVVLIPIFIDGNPLPSNPTPPSGFALAPGMPVQIPATSGSHSLYLYWKRLTGADAGTYAFTLPSSRYLEAQAHLYDNVLASGTPFDPSPGAAFETTGSTTTPVISCTTVGPDRKLIHTATNWGGGTWTAASGHTKRMQGGAGVITLSDRSWPTASSTGTVTATCTSSDKRNAWLGALIGTTPDTTTVEGELDAALPALGGQATSTITATGQLDGTLPALQGSNTATATVRGALDGTLPALAGTIDGTITVAGQLDGNLAPLTGSLTATATAAGQLDGILPALSGDFTAAATIHGALAGALPALSGTLAAAASVEAVLDGVLPAVTGSAQATATVRGNLNGVLAAVEGAFDGTTETSGGILAGVLPPLDGSLTATLRARGLLAAALPPLSGDLAGRARTHGLLAATLAPVEGALQGEVVQPSGVLDGRLPALTGSFTGSSAGTALPPVTARVGTPRLAWPTGSPTIRRWPVAAARTAWPAVRPPSLGEE